MTIELFARLQASGDMDDLLRRARRARTNPTRALELGCTALLMTHAREEAYADATQLVCELFAERGQPRLALSASWYAGSREQQRRLLEIVPELDRGRTFALWAEGAGADQSGLQARAAHEFERGGRLARAAICYERANTTDRARTLWSRLAQAIEHARGPAYAAGLSLFNLARTSRVTGASDIAREATVGAVHRLEEAADQFEAMGQRERAFDCYHVLVAIGELTGQLEHVLEGSVNAIRILSEDNLRYHALRLYEHSIELVSRAGEHAAAATLAREMTAYARAQGLPRLATHGALRQADLWYSLAKDLGRRKASAHLIENALLASLMANAELGRYRRVGELYGELAGLSVEPPRARHYGRAKSRYEGADDPPLADAQSSGSLGEHVPPPDVWHVDMLEWENEGSAAEACADILLDPEQGSDPVTRRCALLGRLVALAVEQAPESASARALSTLAGYLAPIGLYAALAPLEALYRNPVLEVRLAAVRALSRYFYKRTFVTLEQALSDPEPAVANEAASAVERLRFDHAWEPLSRIFRTASTSRARLAALAALARIDVAEAAELTLGVLEHGGPEERDAAIQALGNARGERFAQAARAAYPQGSPRLREGIGQVFRMRRVEL